MLKPTILGKILTDCILRIAMPLPFRQLYDYLPPSGQDLTNLKPGLRVKVPLQRREIIGVLVKTSTTSLLPLAKIKPAIAVLDDNPLIDKDVWQLCHWAADYYHHPLGEVLQSALPALLRQGKAAELKLKKNNPLTHVLSSNETTPPLALNEQQSSAVAAINQAANSFQIFLLDGVTGSGKTEVYLQAIANTLALKQQTLILVPEIGLTPQTIQRFRERFSVPVIALHSGLTEREKLNAWLLARSGDASIIIGTRSAIFSPCKNLGLIIIDEEHDLSFKQQEGFRYHARDVAIMRAKNNNIPIVLGSATPCLETLQNVKLQRYQHLVLPMRAGLAKPPSFELLDIRNKTLEEGFCSATLTTIKQHLTNNNQVMIFLNRRGFSPVLMCHVCGWMVMCQRCDKQMTYHRQSKILHCHHCDTKRYIPKQCGQCNSMELSALGLGTERIEQALQKHFTDFSITRIDRDNVKNKGKMQELFAGIHKGEHQILIGTQMLAKGHHFPNVTLVVVIDADGGFFSTDFRATERMGQLLLQVAGRAGRAEKPGKVLIQTHHPDHPLLMQLLQENYHSFAKTLLAQRENTQLPPFSYFALFRAEAYQQKHAQDFLQQVKNLSNQYPLLQILGPTPATMPRKAGVHRVQLLLQAKKRVTLQNALQHLIKQVETLTYKSRVRWSIDIDPVEMS